MSDLTDFANEVADLLRVADGQPVFGRTLELKDAHLVRLIREAAARHEIDLAPSPAPLPPRASEAPTEPQDVASEPPRLGARAAGGAS